MAMAVVDGSTSGASDLAMGVSNEHESDGDGADDEGEEADDADASGGSERIHLGHALGGADL